MENSRSKKTIIGNKIALLALLFMLLYFTANVFAVPFAYAETSYLWARVTKEGVNLYATEHNSKVICLLEKSYYLKINGSSDTMLFVSVMQNDSDFPEICGYVYTDEVELCEDAPQTPFYPTEKVTVSSDSASLKLTPTPSAETVITATNTQSLSYYGEIISYGKCWYYVFYAGKFGYVESNSVTQPKITLHPTPLEKDVPTVVPPQTDDPNEEPPAENKVSPTAEILLIAFVALLAVGLILALFLPGNAAKKKQNNVFDQNI